MYRRLVNRILNKMKKEAMKPYKTDQEGCPYISANQVIRGFALAVIVISTLILFFIRHYAAQSTEVAVLLLFVVVVNLVFCSRLLLLNCKLTDQGLVYRRLTPMLFSYAQLKAAAAAQGLYMQGFHVVLQVDGKKCSIPMEFLQGSYSLILQLEQILEMKIPEKEGQEKTNFKSLILIAILGILLFYIKIK